MLQSRYSALKRKILQFYINRNQFCIYPLQGSNFDLPSTLSLKINPFSEEWLQIYCDNFGSLYKHFFKVQIMSRRADVAVLKLKKSASRSLGTMVSSPE